LGVAHLDAPFAHMAGDLLRFRPVERRTEGSAIGEEMRSQSSGYQYNEFLVTGEMLSHSRPMAGDSRGRFVYNLQIFVVGKLIGEEIR